MARKRASTFTSHGVTLVSHGRRSNLILLKRLLNLLEVSKKSDIGGNLVNSSSEPRERLKDIDIDLSGISLSTDGVGLREARELSDQLVQLFDLYIGSSL
jgi:hypothetical protein